MHNNRSKITLKTYVDLLDRVSKGEVFDINDLKWPETRVANELLRSGLVSDNDGSSESAMGLRAGPDDLAITPEGITALGSWSEQLRKSSFGYKVGDAFLRFLWVVVGAAVVTFSNVVNKLFG